jgi:hypothetical protein
MTQKPQDADLEKVKSLLRRLDGPAQSDAAAPGAPPPAAARPEPRFPKLVPNDGAPQPVLQPVPPPVAKPTTARQALPRLEPLPVKVEVPEPATTAAASSPPARRWLLASAGLLGTGALVAFIWLQGVPMPTRASQAAPARTVASEKAAAGAVTLPASGTVEAAAGKSAGTQAVLQAPDTKGAAPALVMAAAAPDTQPTPRTAVPQDTAPPPMPDPPLPAFNAPPQPEVKSAALVDRLESRPAPPVASPTARSPPPVLPDAVIHDEALIRRLVTQGQDVFEQGHVMSARLLFRRAADSGSAEAALLLGDTFDPERLASLGVRGLAGDIEQSIKWYEKADELGATAAKARLSALAGR